MRIPRLNLKLPEGTRLNKKKLIIITSIITALVIISVFFAKFGFTAFSVKEKIPACVDECSFEENICENAKIFECAIGEDGCKHKVLIKECAEGAKCSTLKTGECYEPQPCDGEFHTCISDFLYKLCENGKTIEDSETKKCPTSLMCNRNSKQFALCVETDY